MTKCSVLQCNKPVKTRGWCQAHYFRWRRTGDAGTTEIVKRYNGQPCNITECNKPAKARGWCQMHHMRWTRHGDPLTAHQPRRRYGSDNNAWTGDKASYTAMHGRLRKTRGAAKNYQCQCGSQAKQWAYDHTDPNQQVSDLGPYSTDMNRYQPMCVSCHKTMDLARLSM